MKKQQGFATLLSSMMLMFLITFNVFIGAKGSLIEQRVATNGTQAQMAFEHAEAGVESVFEILTPTTDTNVTAPTSQRYNAYYDKALGVVVSTGYATNPVTNAKLTDGTSKKIVVKVTLTPASVTTIGGGNRAIVALGDVTFSGSFKASSVDAGGVVNSGVDVSKYVSAKDATGATITDAVKQNNASYAGKTSEEFFMFKYGAKLCPVAAAAGNATGCKAEAKAFVAALGTLGKVCTSSCLPKVMNAAGARILWIESVDTKINANEIIGSATAPVLILLMNGGSIKINGTATIYGEVYVDVASTGGNGTVEIDYGDFDNSGFGNAVIRGSLIASGNLIVKGNGSAIQTGVDGSAGVDVPTPASKKRDSWTDQIS